VATFFQAWRRRQADRQAHEWVEEREAARLAVEDVPGAIRRDVRRVIETLIDGPDEAVADALERLWKLLDPYPELRARFAGLRVVEDAVEFLKSS
jgi:hypothetical protein